MTRCVLCGATGDDVKLALIRWREAKILTVDDRPIRLWYTSEWRCRDVDACWRRVQDIGDEWPVADGRARRRGQVEEEQEVPVGR